MSCRPQLSLRAGCVLMRSASRSRSFAPSTPRQDGCCGLTLGVHSRIDSTIETISRGVKVGNCYVNSNQIGAVVGVQPFGGEGLSGTGPKAGGPHYLARFVTERTLTINTTAAGGNASLLTLGE